jgi:hypothetical protein
MQKIVFILILLLITSCTPKPNKCTGVVKNVYGEAIIWRNLPITLNISSSFPEHLKLAIYRSASTWEKAVGRKMFNILDNSDIALNRNGVSSIHYLTTYEDDRASEQGRASIYWGGDEIKESDIRVNGKNFSYYLDDQDKYHNKVNMEALMLHELGHLLGLNHNDDVDSVMQSTLANETDRISLSEFDTESIRCIY